MRVFAYCCASFRNATRRAAGVEPLLSPPTSALNFDVAGLENKDLLYFDLHGQPDSPMWWGDEQTEALTAMQIRDANLGKAIVFAVNCYLADEGSPMLDALLDAGARFVIGGDGQNWAGKETILGASLLGLWFRRWLALGIPPLTALAWSKRNVRVSAVRKHKRLVVKDALAFRAYYREVV